MFISSLINPPSHPQTQTHKQNAAASAPAAQPVLSQARPLDLAPTSDVAPTARGDVCDGQFDDVEEVRPMSNDKEDAEESDLGVQEAILQQCEVAKAAKDRQVLSVQNIAATKSRCSSSEVPRSGPNQASSASKLSSNAQSWVPLGAMQQGANAKRSALIAKAGSINKVATLALLYFCVCPSSFNTHH
jgi:hypothetical protein